MVIRPSLLGPERAKALVEFFEKGSVDFVRFIADPDGVGMSSLWYMVSPLDVNWETMGGLDLVRRYVVDVARAIADAPAAKKLDTYEAARTFAEGEIEKRIARFVHSGKKSTKLSRIAFAACVRRLLEAHYEERVGEAILHGGKS
jgi:hypothetical protein